MCDGGRGTKLSRATRPARGYAVGAGSGSELRQPLGVAVVGGLMVSQLLTLYITPVVYLYLDKVDRLLKRRLYPLADLPDQKLQVVAAE